MNDDNLHVIYLTKNCNLRCDYCYEGLDKKNEKIDEPTLKKLIDRIIEEAKPDEHIKILFFGGEVFLNEKALFYGLDYVFEKYQQGAHVSACLTTNATLLNRERVRKLFKYGKMLTVEVSLDGRQATHDKFRKFKTGRGSYDFVIKNCKALLQYFPFSTVRMVVSNPEDLYEDAMFLADFGFREFCIQGLRGDLSTYTETSLELFKSEIERIRENFKTRKLTRLTSVELPHVLIDNKITFVGEKQEKGFYKYFLPNGDAIVQKKFNKQDFQHFSKGKEADYNLLKGE